MWHINKCSPMNLSVLIIIGLFGLSGCTTDNINTAQLTDRSHSTGTIGFSHSPSYHYAEHYRYHYAPHYNSPHYYRTTTYRYPYYMNRQNHQYYHPTQYQYKKGYTSRNYHYRYRDAQDRRTSDYRTLQYKSYQH